MALALSRTYRTVPSRLTQADSKPVICPSVSMSCLKVEREYSGSYPSSSRLRWASSSKDENLSMRTSAGLAMRMRPSGVVRYRPTIALSKMSLKRSCDSCRASTVCLCLTSSASSSASRRRRSTNSIELVSDRRLASVLSCSFVVPSSLTSASLGHRVPTETFMTCCRWAATQACGQVSPIISQTRLIVSRAECWYNGPNFTRKRGGP